MARYSVLRFLVTQLWIKAVGEAQVPQHVLQFQNRVQISNICFWLCFWVCLKHKPCKGRVSPPILCRLALFRQTDQEIRSKRLCCLPFPPAPLGVGDRQVFCFVLYHCLQVITTTATHFELCMKLTQTVICKSFLGGLMLLDIPFGIARDKAKWWHLSSVVHPPFQSWTFSHPTYQPMLSLSDEVHIKKKIQPPCYFFVLASQPCPLTQSPPPLWNVILRVKDVLEKFLSNAKAAKVQPKKI